MNRIMHLALVLLAALAVVLLMSGASEVFGQGTYYVSPTPVGTQFFTDAGAVCNGCLLYHYLTGTTTTAAVYQTSTGTAWAQPITLDAAGRATLYVDTTITYRFVLRTSAGALIRDTDPVSLVAPSSFTITDGFVPMGTGASNGLEDSCLSQSGTTLVSTCTAMTINGAALITSSSLGTGYIPFVDDAIVISGAPIMVLAATTSYLTISLPSAADSVISTVFRVPPDVNTAQPLTLMMNYLLSAAPGATANKVRLVTQATVINTSAAATAGDTITLANSNLPADYIATLNVVAGGTYAVGDFVRMSIRRDVSVANDTDADFYIINLGWRYSKQ